MLVSDSVWIPRGANKLPFELSALRVRSLGNTSSIQVHSFIVFWAFLFIELSMCINPDIPVCFGKWHGPLPLGDQALSFLAGRGQ